MDQIIKGNYQVPDLAEKVKTPETEKKEDALREEFEAAALKKLGGSVTFVKRSKKGSFIWKGGKDE